MKTQLKKIALLLSLYFISSCNITNYIVQNKAQTSGLDFSQGKWLLGNIVADSEIKDDLTQIAIKDFTAHLGTRVSYYQNEKSVLLPSKIPLNPKKNAILDLKKGTNFDYYINIKCEDDRNNLENFNQLDHAYYKKQMTFARVTIEVYNLNSGEIIYNQSVIGSIDEDSSISYKPKRTVIMGCYKKILNQINTKSTNQSNL